MTRRKSLQVRDSRMFFQRFRKRLPEWLCKLAFFNAVLALLWLCWRLGFLTASLPETWPLWLIPLGANVVFVIYDLVLTRLIGFYIIRIKSKRAGK